MFFTSGEIVDRNFDVSLSPEDRVMVMSGLVQKEMQRIRKEGNRDDKTCLGNFKILERILEVVGKDELSFKQVEEHLKIVLDQLDRDSQHPNVNLIGAPAIRASLISYMVRMGTNIDSLTAPKELEDPSTVEPSPATRKAVIDAARPSSPNGVHP